MQTTIVERAALVAEWQARAALRCGRNGDDTGFLTHRIKLENFIDLQPYPNLTTCGMVQLLGRNKAMVLGVSKPLINNALRMESLV